MANASTTAENLPYLGYTGGTLNRCAARRTDAAWLKARLDDPASLLVRFFADRPAIDINARAIGYQTGVNGEDAVFLGADSTGRAVFAATAIDQGEEDLPAHIKLIDLRSLAAQGLLPDDQMAMLAQARTLLHWHRHHRFCANCGGATAPADGGYRRHCPSCQGDHFPRTDPVVIMTAVHRGECLLGRGPNFAPGVYSALAGYIEPGETIEEAARREIFEEAGITVGAVHYRTSQPWPFPANLMIGVLCEAHDHTLIIDHEELEDCRWFTRREIEAMLRGDHPQALKTPPQMAIAWHLITAVIEQL